MATEGERGEILLYLFGCRTAWQRGKDAAALRALIAATKSTDAVVRCAAQWLLRGLEAAPAGLWDATAAASTSTNTINTTDTTDKEKTR